MWRNWVDIQSTWASLKSIIVFWAKASLLSEGFTDVAGPGAFNDPDMLIIGNEVQMLHICSLILAVLDDIAKVSTFNERCSPWEVRYFCSSGAS